MPLTPEQIAEIRQRAEKATPGPWDSARYGTAVFGEIWSKPEEKAVAKFWSADEPIDRWCGETDDRSERAATEIFIAASRTDIPALCDSHDSQAARIAELERQLAQRDKALARVQQIASVYRHGGSCKLIRRCGSCDCWKADILAALDQKEPVV